MKIPFYSRHFLAFTVAATVMGSPTGQAQDQQTPAPASAASLPSNIPADSPLADVVKMVQAGVNSDTVIAYINSATNPFNLDAEKIITLKNLGISTDLVTAMFNRDNALSGTATPPPAPVEATPSSTPTPPPSPAPAPPGDGSAPTDASLASPTDGVTINSFTASLSPYGSWVEVDGYGRCWRPTVANYDAAWNPYCDRGHWVYTDYGWYWDSDYAWGATFHYGRWFHHARLGWCWLPDTVWAPSWVVWRSSGDYCGWAPLPPFVVFQPGAGFLYGGTVVGADFDFGLAIDCFVFVSPDHFCDRNPRSACVPRARVADVYYHTAMLNHFDAHSRTFVNRGFEPERIAAASHRAIEPVRVGALPNASREGWRGGASAGPVHASAEAPRPQAGRSAGQPEPQARASSVPAANGSRSGNIILTGQAASPARPQVSAASPAEATSRPVPAPSHTQPVAQPQPRQYGTLTEQSHVVQQNPRPQPSAPAAAPRQEPSPAAAPANHAAPAQENQPQAHNSSSTSSGGNNSSNKQQNH